MAADRPKGVSGALESSATGSSDSGPAPHPSREFGKSHQTGRQKASQAQFPMHEEDQAGLRSGFQTPQGEFDETYKEELHRDEGGRGAARDGGGAEEGDEAGPSQGLERSGSLLGVEEEFQGPDTSSLAAFLLSLINLNPRKSATVMSLSGSSSYSEFVSEYGDSEEEEGEEMLSPQQGAEGRGDGEAEVGGRGEPMASEGAGPGEGGREGEAAQSYGQGAHTPVPGIRRRVARVEGERAAESSRGGHDARDGGHGREPEGVHLGPLSHPRRWLMARLGFTVDPAPPKASSSHGSQGAEQLRSGQVGREGPSEAARGRPTAAGAAQSPTPPPGAHGVGRHLHQSLSKTGGVPSPSSPQRLPPLSEESLLLTDPMRQAICATLPALSQGREWVLLYSTARHGISLHTLYRKSATLPGPCVVVVGEKGGSVCGGYSSCSLQEANRCKYQGTSDTFVFSDLSGAPEVFRASGANRYFVLCSTSSLAFGGGGHFALRLEEDLLAGTTGECETFRSPQLAKEEDFKISHVELWGFAHTSRYAPQSTSTWQETNNLGTALHQAW